MEVFGNHDHRKICGRDRNCSELFAGVEKYIACYMCHTIKVGSVALIYTGPRLRNCPY